MLEHSKSCQTECHQSIWSAGEDKRTIVGQIQCAGGVCVLAVHATVSNGKYLCPEVASVQKEPSRSRETTPSACHFMKAHPTSALPGKGLGQRYSSKASLIVTTQLCWTLDGTAYTAVTSDLPPAPTPVVEPVCGSIFYQHVCPTVTVLLLQGKKHSMYRTVCMRVR